MKTREWSHKLVIFSSSALNGSESSAFLPQSLYLWESFPGTHWMAPNLVWLQAGEKKSLPVIEIKIPGYPAYNVVTVLTEPSQLVGHCIGKRESDV
jgi:hypothetical protein